VAVGRTGPSDRLSALTSVQCQQVSIDRWGGWHDPRRLATAVLQADPVATLDRVAAPGVPDAEWAERWQAADRTMRRSLDEAIGVGDQATGPAVARALSEGSWETLVSASSMPIRDVDAHTVHRGSIVANRGASGIDGLVSTGLGVAATGSRTVVLTGDLSLLHDNNGFLTDQLPSAVFVVVDNNGGGLFDLLPQAAHAPGFDRLFVTPHQRDLMGLAAFHGLDAITVATPETLSLEIEQRLASGGCHLVVIPVDREADLKQRQALDEVARSVVAGIS